MSKNKFEKFPKIRQYKDATHSLAYLKNKAPEEVPKILELEGTVKLHGTNACICFKKDGGFFTQSRNRILSLNNDNAGFCVFATNLVENKGFRKKVEEYIIADDDIYVYGEFCGGNIQSGVALAQLNKMFVIFGVQIGATETDEDTRKWVPKNLTSKLSSKENQVYTVYDFPTYKVQMNTEVPDLSRNELTAITDQVEKECPVAAVLGAKGVGEGVVWKPTHPRFQDSRYWFKVKGTQHSVSKVTTLKPVDGAKIERIANIVEMYGTENRFKQGLDYLKEMGYELNKKSTGHFLKWVNQDVASEATLDLAEADLSMKDIGKDLGTKARSWLFKQEGFV